MAAVPGRTGADTARTLPAATAAGTAQWTAGATGARRADGATSGRGGMGGWTDAGATSLRGDARRCGGLPHADARCRVMGMAAVWGSGRARAGRAPARRRCTDARSRPSGKESASARGSRAVPRSRLVVARRTPTDRTHAARAAVRALALAAAARAPRGALPARRRVRLCVHRRRSADATRARPPAGRRSRLTSTQAVSARAAHALVRVPAHRRASPRMGRLARGLRPGGRGVLLLRSLVAVRRTRRRTAGRAGRRPHRRCAGAVP